MRYWSKGLGRRSALHIEWTKGQFEITVEDGRGLLATVMPPHLVRGEPPPPGEQVIVSGHTLPPIAWRYISVLTEQDFEDMLRLAANPESVRFVAHVPGGRRLFLKVTWLLTGFFFRYLWAWALSKVPGLGRLQQRGPGKAGGVTAAPGETVPLAEPDIVEPDIEPGPESSGLG